MSLTLTRWEDVPVAGGLVPKRQPFVGFAWAAERLP